MSGTDGMPDSTTRSKRDDTVLARQVLLPFVAQHPECSNQPFASVAPPNDLVDEAQFCRLVGIGEGSPVLDDVGRPRRLAVSSA